MRPLRLCLRHQQQQRTRWPHLFRLPIAISISNNNNRLRQPTADAGNARPNYRRRHNPPPPYRRRLIRCSGCTLLPRPGCPTRFKRPPKRLSLSLQTDATWSLHPPPGLPPLSPSSSTVKVFFSFLFFFLLPFSLPFAANPIHHFYF